MTDSIWTLPILSYRLAHHSLNSDWPGRTTSNYFPWNIAEVNIYPLDSSIASEGNRFLDAQQNLQYPPALQSSEEIDFYQRHKMLLTMFFYVEII
jgi:hypothetical protein